MKSKLTKLIDVKSIMTLILVCVFAYLSIKGKVTSTEFLTIFTVIISFYFHKESKTDPNKKNESEE